MKFSLLAALGLFSVMAFGQIITPAYVISNAANGIKTVVTEERTEFRDFRETSTVSYNKQGFPTHEIKTDIYGKVTETLYSYSFNEDDSTFSVTTKINVEGEEPQSHTYNYLFANGDLWESKPAEANETVTEYKHYKYDENWNLLAMDELKVIGADTSITKRNHYSVQTDVFHRLITTNHTGHDMPTLYNYNEEGVLLSTSIFDGDQKRSTEHRMYNEKNQLELTMNVLNRGGALLSIKRYTYETYRKGKPSIFEKLKPVAHPESVMQER